MKAAVSGQLVSIGASVYEGKSYPYYELLQIGSGRAEIVRISGDTLAKVGEKITVEVNISVNERGKLRLKNA